MTGRLWGLVRVTRKTGGVGAAQNVVGGVMHAVTTLENAERVVEAFKQVLPVDKIIVSEIDFQGARLIG